MKIKIRSTTIVGVRHKGKVAMAGDGQVTFGDMAFKQKAVKVREFITTYNKWFATNHRVEEFILQVDEDVSPGADNSRRGDAPKKVGTVAKIAKGINKFISPMKNFVKGKGYKFDD